MMTAWCISCGGAEPIEPHGAMGSEAGIVFTEVTQQAGLGGFRHVTGATGNKWFPERQAFPARQNGAPRRSFSTPTPTAGSISTPATTSCGHPTTISSVRLAGKSGVIARRNSTRVSPGDFIETMAMASSRIKPRLRVLLLLPARPSPSLRLISTVITGPTSSSSTIPSETCSSRTEVLDPNNPEYRYGVGTSYDQAASNRSTPTSPWPGSLRFSIPRTRIAGGNWLRCCVQSVA